MGGAGAFCGVELLTPDVELSDSFYGAVFGEGTFGAAVRRRVVPEGLGRFLLHFGCADADATAAAAVRLGGRVRVRPYPTVYGRAAVIEDDQGAVFAVCEQE